MPSNRPFWWREPAEKERRKKYMVEWAMKNPDAKRANFSSWREKNKDYDKARCLAWEKNNRPRANATSARRKAAMLRRTPSWADHEAIATVYEQCDYIERLTGIAHEVDHFYPLQGKTVSGLHVQNNLRLLTAKENRRKGNRHV